MPSETVSVTAFYNSTVCWSATYLQLEDTSSCNSPNAECQLTTDGIYSYETFCTPYRNEAIAATFEGERFIVQDTYSDTACTEYISSTAYKVGGCIYVNASTSVIATLDATSSSGMLGYYYNDPNCEATPKTYMIDKSAFASEWCITYDGSKGYKMFTSSTLKYAYDTSSSGSNSSGSTTVAPSTTASPPTASPAPSSTPAGATTSSGFGTSAVVGIAAGVIVAIVIIFALVVCCRRRKRNAEATNGIQAGGEAVYHHRKSDTPDVATQPSTGSLQQGNRNRDSVAGLWDGETIISWRVPREKVRVGRLLSRGGYGEVFMGVYNGQEVAVKMLLPETRRSVKHVNAFLSEVKMMAALEHARIVQFIGVAWDSFNDLCVLSEFMAGGDLRALLAQYEATSHPQGFDYHKVKIALHIAHALTYLHSLAQPVIHRDLKSKNVLLTPELDAKLTDFGISRERVDRTMTAGVGTSLWMAPEVMMGEKYDVAADMFSFGVLLSELDTQALPYSHAKDSRDGQRVPDAAILQMMAMGSLRVKFSTDTLPELTELGDACVSTDPKARPAAAEALYKLQKILQRM